MTKAIIVVIAVAIIGGGGYLALNKSDETPEPTSSSARSQSSPQSEESSPDSESTPDSTDTIIFEGTKFIPDSITVKSGTTVTVKNESSQDLEFASDPHPIHNDDTDLNAGFVAPGQSITFTAAKTGTYGFHNHLDSSVQGNITVE